MRGDEPLAESALAMLSRRLEKARKQVGPAAKGDADGVHDLRVAIRKIRAALSVLDETVLTNGALDKDDARLSRLFSALGEVRDHDVLVERVTRTAKRRRLDEKTTAKLLRDLDRRGKQASKELRRLMRAHDPRSLFDKLRHRAARALRKAVPHGDDHRMLVRHFAGSVLLRRYETVLAYELVVPAPIDVLHRLRVAIKKLRYAVDFFAEALGPRAARLDRTLQTAQDQLGDLHDHDVERAMLAAALGKRASKGHDTKALEKLRHAEDEEAARLLAAFAKTWKAIADGSIADALTASAGALLGRAGARRRTLALRRAEQHAR
jgi:CHAD domain-containing protein